MVPFQPEYRQAEPIIRVTDSAGMHQATKRSCPLEWGSCWLTRRFQGQPAERLWFSGCFSISREITYSCHLYALLLLHSHPWEAIEVSSSCHCSSYWLVTIAFPLAPIDER